MSATRQPRLLDRAGFTLTELLAVIAIVGILSALIIGTVGRVRAQAADAQCRSALRQWGLAMQLYTNDNKGRFPGPSYSYVLPQQSSNHIANYLASYIGLNEAAGKAIPLNYICRGWTADTPDLTAPVYLLQGIPLPTNPSKSLKPFGVVGSSAGAPLLYAQVAAQVEPSRSVIMGEVDKLVTDAGTAGVASSYGPRVPQQPVHGEHRNELYLDWHVDSAPVVR
jgi:prepilin-type N-terminal cleavage/methylation domain-containing protein